VGNIPNHAMAIEKGKKENFLEEKVST